MIAKALPTNRLLLSGPIIVAMIFGLQACSFDNSRLDSLRDQGVDMTRSDGGDLTEDPDVLEDPVEDPAEDVAQDTSLDTTDVAEDPDTGDTGLDLPVGVCPDGVRSQGEQCDGNGETAICDDDCTLVVCGDGNYNALAGENCDDGDNDPNDGCDASCNVETNWTCFGDDVSVCYECGDGVVDGPVTGFSGELCDDGNATNCGTCPAGCGIGESGPVFGNTCGDGIAECGEHCDTDDLDDLDCTDFGYASAGTLACASDCLFDLTGCSCSGTETDTDDDGTCDLEDIDDDDDGCDDDDDVSPLSAPNEISLDILFVAADDDSNTEVMDLNASDTAWLALLRTRHTVDLFEPTKHGCSEFTDDQTSYDDAIAGYDILWVSNSCTDNHLIDADDGTFLDSLAIPVISLKREIWDNMELATTIGDNDNETQIDIPGTANFATDHITESGLLTVYTGDGRLSWGEEDGNSDIAPGAVLLVGDPGESDRFTIFYVETGGDLLPGADPGTATNFRMAMGMVRPTLLEDVAKALVFRIVLLAAGHDDVEPFIDGDDNPTHCDLCPALYNPGDVDADGDGVGAACDCDDAVPTCTDDCVTNSDAGDEPDGFTAPNCYEVACGSNPIVGADAVGAQIGDDCLLVEDSGDLSTALDAATAQAGHEMILVTVDPFGNNPSMVCPTDGFDMRFSVPWDITGNEGLSITGESGCVLSGVQASNTDHRVFKILAPGTTIRDFEITDCEKVAIRVLVAASDTTIENVRIRCNFDAGNNDAAILIEGADGTQIIGNVISHPDDGIQLNNGSDDTVIDHNTFVGPSDRGVLTVSGANNLCIRNNIFTGVTSAVALSTSTTWDASCAAELDDSTWNNAVDNITNLCAGGTCAWTSADCPGSAHCLPADEQLFFEFSGIYEVDPGFDGNFCIDSPNLVDSATDLGYDRNGADGGDFNGSGPDIGGREAGSGLCTE